MATIKPFVFSTRLEQLSQIISPETGTFLVGGAVRDAFLGLEIHDMDFVVEQDAISVARRVADVLRVAFYPLDTERDTGRVILIEPGNKRLLLDFSLQRGPDLESDLRARDFTVNAMAVDIHHPQRLIDPLGGIQDLRSKILKACSEQSFTDDSLRIVRGVRLATSFELRIQPETLELMRRSIRDLRRISQERLRDELFRILDGTQPSSALRILDYLGILPYILPELAELKGLGQPPPHITDAWEHTLNVVQNLENVVRTLALEFDPDLSANLWLGLISLRLGRYREQLHAHLGTHLNPDRSLRGLLLLAALYHDVAKPQMRSVDEAGDVHFYGHDEQGSHLAARRARMLHLSNEESDRLAAIVRYHMRPILLGKEKTLPTRRAIYRFFRDAGYAGIDVCLLSMADVLATYGPGLPQELWGHHLDTVRELFDAWWEHREEKIFPPTVINGTELMERLGLPPGPQVGKILAEIREAQAMGQVNNFDQALALARSLIGRG